MIGLGLIPFNLKVFLLLPLFGKGRKEREDLGAKWKERWVNIVY